MNILIFILLLLKTIVLALISTLHSCILFFIPNSFLFKSVRHNVVLITGAGSGLGAALAIKFAKRKCQLILWDINKEGLEKTMDQCRQYQSESYISIFQIDITNREKVLQLAEKIESSIGPVDILINNAGIVNGKSILDLTPESVSKVFNVNVISHFWTIQAFLPAMLNRNSGHIVSISSIAGQFGANKLTDYCSSKFAAFGLQESLMHEIRALNKSGVKTLSVCPFYINTGMFNGVTTDCPILNIMDLSYATTRIEEAILTNETVLILPRIVNLFIFLKGLLPTKAFLYFVELAGTNESMDTFIGRK